MRVVSLLPSATEMLYALGVEPVGVSHECDFPPEATDLPTVIRSRVDASASSGEIDEQVQSAVDSGGVYEIDRETLAALDPDVIVSQGICDVCAVDDSQIRQAVTDLNLDTDILTSDPHSLEDVFDDIERLGRRLGREEQASDVRQSLERRVQSVAEATPETGPRVAVLDWLDPVMVAGHWIPGMIDRIGGEYGMAAPGDPSRPREWADVLAYDPDVLLAAPCGFGLDQIRENASDLTGRERWQELTAVKQGRVYAIDGHHYINRPGPRLVESLEALAGAVYPDSVEAPDDAVDEFPPGERAVREALD